MTYLRSPQVLAFTLIALVVVTFASGSHTGSAGTPGEQSLRIQGTPAFPPSNLSAEQNATELADWLDSTLTLNLSNSALRSTADATFLDGFNRTIAWNAIIHEFQGSEADLRLWYAASTGEFISVEVSFPAGRVLRNGSLRDYSTQLANSLGIPLANASYAEFSIARLQEDPNGTGFVAQTETYGDWLEHRDYAEVNFANQLRVIADSTNREIRVVRAYRWIADPPFLTFAQARVVSAASESVNRSSGSARVPSFSSIGITPNYDNLSWSVLVELNYAYQQGGYEFFIVLLDARDLTFQKIVLRGSVVPTGPRGALLQPLLLAALVAASVIVAVLFSIAWFSQFEARWALAGVSLLIPLYSRLRRESVLDHFLRGRIVEFLQSNPGANFASLKNKFGVANGVLTHHLWVLSRTGFTRAVREANFTRYYSSEESGRGPLLLADFQYSILRIVHSSGSKRLRELASELESSKQRVHYNVRRLVRQGLLTISAHGAERSVTLSDRGIELIREDGETRSSRPTAE